MEYNFIKDTHNKNFLVMLPEASNDFCCREMRNAVADRKIGGNLEEADPFERSTGRQFHHFCLREIDESNHPKFIKLNSCPYCGDEIIIKYRGKSLEDEAGIKN